MKVVSTILSSCFIAYCQSVCELDESAIEVLLALINETTSRIFGSITEANIRSLLKTLASKPEVTSTTATVVGPTPKGTKAFLDQLRVAKTADFAGNDAAFQARDVKTFDRKRYGVPPSHSEFNIANTQVTLANPTLRTVRTEGCFQAQDSTGMGFKHQYRICNLLTSEWVTPMMDKGAAEEQAAQMNSEFVQSLHERTMQRESRLPQTELGESLMTPLSQSKIDAVNAALGNNKFTMAGSIGQSDYSVEQSPAKAFKETAMLVEARKQKFHENTDVTESMAIHSEQLKGLRR